MIVNELQIWKAVLDPVRDAGQHLSSVLVAIADHHAGNHGGAMRILVFNLGSGDIEILMERSQERLQPAALFLQGGAARKVQLQSQYVDMHQALNALGPVRVQVAFFQDFIGAADLRLGRILAGEAQLKYILKAGGKMPRRLFPC